MSTTDIRAESHQILDRIDKRFLTAVHALLRTYDQEEDILEQKNTQIVSYDVVTNQPRTTSELTTILDQEVESIKDGNFTTLEDFQKQSTQWGQSTK